MEDVTLVGIDLGKHVFHLHGQNKAGKAVFRKKVSRKQLVECFATLHACTVVMEACAGARKLATLGHQVKLISPHFVRPFVKGNKNDFIDAEAICEAAARPSMRFVTPKTESRRRSGQASVLTAEMGDGKQYGCSRDFAASLGLVPRQYSTGGRSNLLGISKRGDKHLRWLLVQCARAAMRWLDRQCGPMADWVRSMLTRRHPNVVACALANKLARVAWALAAHNTTFNAGSAVLPA